LAEKKAEQLPPLKETLVAPDPNDELATILELDELWSNAPEEKESSVDMDCSL